MRVRSSVAETGGSGSGFQKVRARMPAERARTSGSATEHAEGSWIRRLAGNGILERSLPTIIDQEALQEQALLPELKSPEK